MAMVPPSFSAEVIDLRRGARTMLYGGKFVPPPGDNNPPTGDFHGWFLASGDIDGDGYQDLLSGSPYADGPGDSRFSSGDVYVVFGGPRSSLDSLYRDLTLDADITIYGARDGDRLGWSARCADLDRDGYDEIVLAAGAGEIDVFYGGPRETLEAVYDLRFVDPDIRIVGVGGWNFDGSRRSNDAVSYGMEVGDINGDGYSDLFFSALEATPPEGLRAAGIVYAVLGRKRCRMPPLIDCDYGTSTPHPNIVIYGADNIDRFGFAFAGADLDGDGIDELLAIAYGGDGEENLRNAPGEIYGFWGRKTWNEEYDISLEEFDFAIQWPTELDEGYRLTAGDLDGDGIDDLVVGFLRNLPDLNLPDGRRQAGEYRILFGRPRPQWPRWTDIVPSTDVLIIGADTGDTSTASSVFSHGISLSIGNRNADAFEDLLITAAGGDGPPYGARRDNAGEAYLLLGRPRVEWEPFYDLREDYDLIIYGAEGSGLDQGIGDFRQDAFGWASVMADLDGNGKDEIIVSALFADGPSNFRPDCGEVYVIYDPDSTDVIAARPRHPGPPKAALLPSYPNPFSGATTLRFTAPEGSIASLSIYDAFGRRVSAPVQQEPMYCDEREVTWEPTDSSGQRLASGVYFARLVVNGEVHTAKMILVR